jgi:hypothetical protein
LFNFARQPRLPYVQLTVGATAGWFLVDTGASRHVMSAKFFRAAFPGRVTGRTTGVALSWAGRPQPMSEARALPVAWPDGARDALDFAAASGIVPDLRCAEALLHLGLALEAAGESAARAKVDAVLDRAARRYEGSEEGNRLAEMRQKLR